MRSFERKGVTRLGFARPGLGGALADELRHSPGVIAWQRPSPVDLTRNDVDVVRHVYMHKYFCIYICLLSVFHGLASWRLPNTKLALLFGAFESVLSTFGERRAASARKETSQTFWFLGLFKGVSQKTTQGCSGFWDSKTKQPILTLNEKTNKS